MLYEFNPQPRRQNIHKRDMKFFKQCTGIAAVPGQWQNDFWKPALSRQQSEWSESPPPTHTSQSREFSKIHLARKPFWTQHSRNCYVRKSLLSSEQLSLFPSKTDGKSALINCLISTISWHHAYTESHFSPLEENSAHEDRRLSRYDGTHLKLNTEGEPEGHCKSKASLVYIVNPVAIY